MIAPQTVVVGCGCVGEATARVLEAPGIEVGRHDPARGVDLSSVSGPRTQDVIICLPTPGTTDATPADLDCEAVEAELRAWGERCSAARLVVRSTVPPTFWARLPWPLRARCVHWPCFAEHWRIEEFEAHPPFVVFGIDQHELALRQWVDVCPPWLPLEDGSWVIVCSLETASWTKLATNVLYAANVVLANELAALGAGQGADWEQVRRALDANPRLGDTFALSAAGGYGGECLMKDVGQVVALAKQHLHGWPLRLLPVLPNANDQAKSHRAEAPRHAG